MKRNMTCVLHEVKRALSISLPVIDRASANILPLAVCHVFCSVKLIAYCLTLSRNWNETILQGIAGVVRDYSKNLRYERDLSTSSIK